LIVAVRELTATDVRPLARTLGAAFYDDPVMRWLLPDDARRLRQARSWFGLLLRDIYLRAGASYTTDDVLGGALWMPPGGICASASRQLALLKRIAPILEHDLHRFLEGLSFIGSHRPTSPPHYYLTYLGVQPDSQGQGIGTKLIRPILERCDTDRTPAYLEATTARNRELYARIGFELIGALDYPHGGPTTWRMWRDPVAAPRLDA
jgi:GNAT superfamily N-acetyltransferase